MPLERIVWSSDGTGFWLMWIEEMVKGCEGSREYKQVFKYIFCKYKGERKENSQFGSRESIWFSFKRESCHGYYCMDLIKGKY